MLRNSIVYFFLSLFCSLPAKAQPSNGDCSTVSFQKELVNNQTGLFYKYLNVALTTSDKGFIIGGRMFNTPLINNNFMDSIYITKLSSTGDILWSKQMGFHSYLQKIIELPGNEYLLSYSNSSADTVFLTRLNSDGDPVWSRYYCDNTFVPGNIIIVYDTRYTDDGNILLQCMGDDGGKMIKLDLAGNVLWANNYRPQNLVSYTISGNLFNNSSIIEDEDGYIVMLPYLVITNFNTDPITLIKINKTSGAVIWTKEIGFPGYNLYSQQLLKTGNGFAVILAKKIANINEPRKLTVINFTADASFSNAFQVMGINSRQNFLFTNNRLTGIITDTASTGFAGCILYQLDTWGNVDWAKKYLIPVDDLSVQVLRPQLLEAPDKGFIMILNRKNTTNTETQNFIFKTDQTGNAGDCDNRNINIITQKVYPLITTLNTTMPACSIVSGYTSTQINDEPLTSNTICFRTSTCDEIHLSGPTSICNIKQPLLYSIKRNSGCYTTPVWKLADSSMGKITLQTDTTATVEFYKPGNVIIIAAIPTACDSIQDSITVVVQDSPDSIDLGRDTAICGNFSITLNAKEGFKSYAWQDGSSDAAITVTTPGKYYVTTKDYCNDSYADTIVITPALPPLLLAGNDTMLCPKDTVLLTATGGFNNYSWIGDHISSTNTQTVKVFPEETTTYYLSAEKSPGCISTDSVTIGINAVPGIILGKDTAFCQGNYINLDAGPGFSNYSWSSGETTQQVIADKQGSYSIKAFTANGCYATDTLNVLAIYSNPEIALPKDSTLCKDKTLLLDAGAGYDHYLWNTGTTSQSIIINDTGTYKVTVTDKNGCSGSGNAIFKTIVPPPTGFIITDTAFCAYETITLSPSRYFPSYLWSTGSTASFLTIKNAGTYWLQVTDKNGCQAKEFIRVQTKDCEQHIYFPNSFTPNADGLNDIFQPKIFGVPEQYKLWIYNRWGQKIFETNDYTKGWDGKIAGIQQNNGAYSWISSFRFINNPAQFRKGSLLLIR